jgi:hypothetical protein
MGHQAEADVADETQAVGSVIGIADHVVAIVHEDQAAAAVVRGVLGVAGRAAGWVKPRPAAAPIAAGARHTREAPEPGP